MTLRILKDLPTTYQRVTTIKDMKMEGHIAECILKIDLQDMLIDWLNYIEELKKDENLYGFVSKEEKNKALNYTLTWIIIVFFESKSGEVKNEI